MAGSGDFEFEDIGGWSEIKLDIIREYASAYSRILAAQNKPSLHHVYIDAFAGAGGNVSRETGDFVAGSPLNALQVRPPFREYHFIDLNQRKVASLEDIARERTDVRIHHGDCNATLLETVLPQVRFEDYKRALCILDPYGLHLDWQVIARAGEMRSIEIFLNFPVADINRNVLWRRREGVSADQEARLIRFWGDDSWKEVAYRPAQQQGLFGAVPDEKVPNDEFAAAFRERLKNVAGFPHVPEPIAMRNSRNAIVYYLYFASPRPVAGAIVDSIFNKYRNKGRR